MSTDTSPDLFKAILAMDSYNRDYNRGINLSGSYLGSAEILTTSSTSLGIAIDSSGTPILDEHNNSINKDFYDGFYAIAYQYSDASGTTQTTIAYRGTDEFTATGGMGGDIVNSYEIGMGSLDANQATDAFAFYNAVAAMSGVGTISVTGHSMGGGLAGMLSELKGGVSATVFDSPHLAETVYLDTPIQTGRPSFKRRGALRDA